MQKALRKDKSATAKQHHASDLRGALDWLRRQGDLIETDKPVDPDLEVTGLQKHMDGGCPVLFNNVKGKPDHRVLTNLFGDIKVINKMFGWKDDAERVRKLAYSSRVNVWRGRETYQLCHRGYSRRKTRHSPASSLSAGKTAGRSSVPGTPGHQCRVSPISS